MHSGCQTGTIFFIAMWKFYDTRIVSNRTVRTSFCVNMFSCSSQRWDWLPFHSSAVDLTQNPTTSHTSIRIINSRENGLTPPRSYGTSLPAENATSHYRFASLTFLPITIQLRRGYDTGWSSFSSNQVGSLRGAVGLRWCKQWTPLVGFCLYFRIIWTNKRTWGVLQIGCSVLYCSHSVRH